MDNKLFFGPSAKFIERYAHVAATYSVQQNSWVLYFPVLNQGAPVPLAELLEGQEIEHLTIIVGDNAHGVVYDWLPFDKHPNSLNVYLGAAAIFDYYALFIGAGTSELSLTIHLRGQYAQANLQGVYLLHGTQKFALNTAQYHDAPDTTSTLVMRGAVGGNAVVAYAGNIVVGTQAARSNAAQHNKNLLMSDTARASSVPSLEVLTNEVSCAHGSATGPVDEAALWYLQSRGISADRARLLLTQAFFAEVVQKFPVSMRDEFDKRLGELEK